jgi:Zn-dependent metalloprotease
MKDQSQLHLALALAAGIVTTTSAVAAHPFQAPVSAPGFSMGGIQLPSRALVLPLRIQNQLRGMGLQIAAPKNVSNHGISTQRYQLQRDGIEVLGAMAMAHRGLVGDEVSSSETVPTFSISTKPGIAAEQASSIVLGLLGNRDLEVAPELKILPSEKEDGSAQLIYWVTVAPNATLAGRDILINAHQGTLLADMSHDIEIAPSEVLMANEECQTLDESTGYPLMLEPRNCAVAVSSGSILPIADESALRASENQEAVLKYYWSTHGRDSYDDRGSVLTSVVHVGRAFNNAFWNSKDNFMAYGDGDGKFMTDLTKSLDVAGHEMTHGVTSQTSQLIYQSESGALNEAFSDFFGVVVAARAHQSAPDWAIGKDIFANERKLVGLRNLKNPGSIMARVRDDEGKPYSKPYPAHMSEAFTTKNPCSQANDRCFVHINSMIPGHAMYQITEAIGLDKAEKLMYVTLTQYLTKTSTFKIFKTQTMKACRQLNTTADCRKVRDAFAVVGL